MQASLRKTFALRFADCMARLKNIGLQCSVSVSASGVVITTTDKASASVIRRAAKRINADDVLVVETRANDLRVFTFAV